MMLLSHHIKIPLLFFLALLPLALGFPSGDNLGPACSSLFPAHGTLTQTSPSPYKITFSPASYTPGSEVTVTISSCTPTGFKGFMIQARRANMLEQSGAIGNFQVVTSTKAACPGNVALVHTSGSVKSSLTFKWIAPATAQGHIQFRAAFVQVKLTFWSDFKSEVLLDASLGGTPDPSTVTTPSTLHAACAAPTTSVQVLQNGNFVKDSTCEVTKGCFSDCSNTNGCTYQVAWKEVGDSAEYTLTAKIAGTNVWVALGFSSDQTMGGDSVTGCYYQSGAAVVFNAKNVGKSTPTMLASDGVTLKSGQVTNGVFSCTFTRLKAAGLNGDRYDITQPWYLLLAWGQYMSGINYHGLTGRVFSTQKYSLSVNSGVTSGTTQPTQPTQPPTTTQVSGRVTKDPQCGVTKGCYSSCGASSCSFVVAWQVQGNNGIYTISADVHSGSGEWAAIGFSDDDSMGDESVTGCLTGTDGAVKVFNAQNTGKSQPTMFNDSAVILLEGSMKDGVLTCTFQQPIDASNDKKRPNLNEDWTYLFARGSTSTSSNGNVVIQFHYDKQVSAIKFSVFDKTDSGSKALRYPLVIAHGSLMIGAWIFFASVGIVAARYYKPTWQNLMCSQKVWFQIHRMCMVFVFLATAAGFILIFIEVEGWSDIIESKSYLEGHPIMGIIVMALTVINPVMALFRPHPGTTMRPIFNWAHWFVGTAAHILGVVTIFFGVQLNKADAPHYLVYILAAYVAWQIFVELLLELISCCGRRKERKEMYELGEEYVGDQKPNPAVENDQATTAKRVILALHLFVVSAFTAVLIGLIAVGERELEE